MIDLRLGDCLEILPTLEPSSVDAVVTDPPYGIGFKYDSGAEIAKTPASYWEWLEPRYREWWRCLKPGGFMAVWQAQLNFRHFWDWFGDGIRIYAACKNFVQIRPTPINYAYDPVVMIYKEGVPLRPEKPARSVDFFVGISSWGIRRASSATPRESRRLILAPGRSIKSSRSLTTSWFRVVWYSILLWVQGRWR